MNPKEVRCRHCGKRILFVPAKGGGRLPIDAELSGYKRLPKDSRQGDMFYTNQGGVIRGTANEETPDGYAHKPHFLSCGKK